MKGCEVVSLSKNGSIEVMIYLSGMDIFGINRHD
jgi:hypothetical protein